MTMAIMIYDFIITKTRIIKIKYGVISDKAPIIDVWYKK